MTSQKDIQSLISDIDSLLPQANSRLPWSQPQDIDNLHQVLVKLRNFLVSLPSDHSVAASENLPTAVQQPPQEAGEQVLQIVTQQMNCLRADLLSYLQTDLEALRQQRQSLVREIQQQEDTQRRLHLLNEQKTIQQQQLISEFSRELINRCSASLSQKLAQILGNWEERLFGNASITGARIPTLTNLAEGEEVRVSLEAREKLRQMQQHSDQMLSNLDANQQLIFETLQSNLQSYQQSLSQSMAKMHHLNSQVEGLCTELVERLVQQLLPSDVLLTTNQITPSQQNLQTLLPNQDWSIREQQVADLTLGLMIEPKPLSGNQIRLQLPSPEAEINPIARNQVSGEDDQEISVYLPKEPGNLTDSPKQGILNSQELNMEELYWENLGIELDNHDLINTLIQLDINEQEEDLSEDSLFPVAEKEEIPSPSDSQAPDSSSYNQEIDDLYTTLFGTDTLTTTVELDESDSPPPLFDSLDKTTLGKNQATGGEGNSPNLVISAASKLGVVNLALLEKHASSTSVEEVLFEGFRDPAAEVTPTSTLELSPEHSEASWEVLFFEDSTTELPEEEQLARNAQTGSLATITKPAEVDTITKLTDLLEQMGWSYLPVEEVADVRLAEQVPNKNSPASINPVKAQQQPPYPTVETQPQTNPVEEPYIHASKDEILLAEDESDNAPGPEMVLAQAIMQQLSEDLGHFEEDETQTLATQEENSSADQQEASPNTAVTENEHQQQPKFSRSEELLAEDWEELSLHNEGEEIKVIRDETSFNLSTSEASELIASNFDPGLFPPEIPQLDQLNLVNDVGLDASVSEARETESSNPSPTEEVVESSVVEDDDSTNIPAELLPIDDETFTEIFIEMLQDKPQPDLDSSPE
ncbi:MAG: hypothetical protein F6K31_12000 [Symploca sp. SIO2G7]|nr:hypothetical protein [Symploca sp. SIO2G7]